MKQEGPTHPEPGYKAPGMVPLGMLNAQSVPWLY